MTTEQETKPRNGGQHSYVLASIPVEMIELREQIRQDWEHDDGAERMQQLTDTVKEWGILQPLLVKPMGEGGRYRLVAGHRRYKSAVEAGDLMVPCMIWNGRDEDIPLIQLIENIQRQHVSFADRARALQKLVDEGRSHKSVDREVGTPEGATSKVLRVARNPVLMSALADGLIAESRAKMLTELHDNYSTSLYDMLRNHQRVTSAMVDEARQQQHRDGVVKDAQIDRRGLTDYTKARIDDVGRLTDQGLTPKEIAAQLGISESMAYNYRNYYRHGPAKGVPLSMQALRSLVASLFADGLSEYAIRVRTGMGSRAVERIVQEIKRDAATSPEPKYFTQPDPSDAAPTTNAARSLIPLRPLDAAAPPPPPNTTANTSANTRPHPVQQPWENRAEDAGPRVTQATPQPTTGLQVKTNIRDPFDNEIRPRDTVQASAPAQPLTRYVKDPTLADMMVVLRNYLIPLLRLLAWASGRGMTVAQLHDEIKALYEL